MKLAIIHETVSRRDFLKTSGAAISGLGSLSSVLTAAPLSALQQYLALPEKVRKALDEGLYYSAFYGYSGASGGNKIKEQYLGKLANLPDAVFQGSYINTLTTMDEVDPDQELGNTGARLCDVISASISDNDKHSLKMFGPYFGNASKQALGDLISNSKSIKVLLKIIMKTLWTPEEYDFYDPGDMITHVGSIINTCYKHAKKRSPFPKIRGDGSGNQVYQVLGWLQKNNLVNTHHINEIRAEFDDKLEQHKEWKRKNTRERAEREKAYKKPQEVEKITPSSDDYIYGSSMHQPFESKLKSALKLIHQEYHQASSDAPANP